MTYFDSAAGQTITKARALKELQSHGINHPTDVDQFYADMGDHETYSAKAVLEWLGY